MGRFQSVRGGRFQTASAPIEKRFASSKAYNGLTNDWLENPGFLTFFLQTLRRVASFCGYSKHHP
jgi:hypothetical protein